MGCNVAKESTALFAGEPLFSERQGMRKGHRCRVFPPALRIIKKHLPVIILYEMPDDIAMQIDIEGSCHCLSLPCRRWGELHFDSQGMQDGQGLPQLTGRFALFQFYNEAQARTRG